MKHAFWNINGYKSKIIGNKLVNRDFIDEIKGCDIVGLVETHVHSKTLDQLAIPGFKRIDYKIREPHSKGRCGSGGIALFCKNHITTFLTPIQNANEDVIWTKIKKELLGEERDIYLATIYISPTGNKDHIVSQFGNLRQEIEHFQRKGKVILQGDLNARTSNQDEIIVADKFDQESEQNNFTAPHRNSEDILKTDLRGEELLELCKGLNIIILNGRKIGDPFGKITSYQWNGKAVVDYVISSLDLFNSITCFKVGNYSPFISDHCPLFYEVHSKIEGKKQEENLQEQPGSFYLNPSDRQKLIESLKSPEQMDRLAALNSPDQDPQEMVAEMYKILLDACSRDNIKPRRKPSRSKNDDPWFDRECQKLKNSIKRKCQILRKNSSKTNLHADIFKENKLYKNMIKKKKNEYKLKIINEMGIKKSEQKTYWRLLGRLSNSKTDSIFQNKISGETWKNYFKGILNDTTREIVYPPDSDNAGPLDGIITKDELSKAIYILKPNKSSGCDLISNEMILSLVEIHPDLLVNLFNRIFSTNTKIQEWTIAAITPIFKSGVKTDPNNYRGISLLSCLGKLFSAILNQGLIRYAVDNNILKREQLGFLPGNRTSDAHIILNTLIQYYCHKKNKKIFACFVDFKKAFDTIPRDLLFRKLLGHGVTGKFFNTLKTIYKNDTCCVKVDGKMTRSFEANQGVKQGCVLSPLLFNIFISDIVSRFDNEVCTPLQFDNSQTIGSLIWADDPVILSESENGLQNMLKNLSSYAVENRMEINLDKTKCMIFNKTGKFLRRIFEVGDEKIYSTSSYKYLGFIMTPSGEINTGLKDLKDRALRAFYSLKGKLGKCFMFVMYRIV